MLRDSKGRIVSDRQRINEGRRERICYGKSHPEGKWMPETSAYFPRRKKGGMKFQSVCKQCSNLHHSKLPPEYTKGVVPHASAVAIFEQIVLRLGKSETARRLGFTKKTMANILKGRTKTIRKENVKLAILLLDELQRTGEIRSKKDIHRGAHLRGKKELPPTNRGEFYNFQRISVQRENAMQLSPILSA